MQSAITSEAIAIGYIEQRKFIAALSALDQIPSDIEDNSQQFFSHIKALKLHVENCPYVFNQVVVTGFITNNDMIGLKSYLERFLRTNPIDNDIEHPGFWLLFYELEMLTFYEKNKVELAVENFNTNSNLLKLVGNDCMLCPVDLEARIQRIKTNLSKREIYTNQKQKTTAAFLDYARLYFRELFWPELQKDDSWTQFVRNEAGYISCLACSWTSDKTSENNFKKHFIPTENSRVNRCSSITFHLAKRARQVFKITGQFPYADFLSVYKKGKKSGLAVKHVNNESSLSSRGKSIKRIMIESEASPSSKSYKRTRTEGASASSPDGKPHDVLEVIAVDSETASGIFGHLLKLNVDLKAAASSEIQQLCDVQGDLIYKLSRKAELPMELLLDLYNLDEVNSKFAKVMADQSSSFEVKMLEIVDMTYKLRVFCMTDSAGEVRQNEGSDIHHFIGKLIGSVFHITGLIGKAPALPEHSIMKEICTVLNREAAKVMKLYEEHNLVKSEIYQWVMVVASIRKRFLLVTGSVPNLLTPTLLHMDEAIYKIGRLCLQCKGFEES